MTKASKVVASIVLSERCKRNDIPRVLVSVDYFDDSDMIKLYFGWEYDDCYTYDF